MIEFGSYGDGTPSGLTRAEVFETFKKAVQHVWRNADFVLHSVWLSKEQPPNNVLAAVLVQVGFSGSKPVAIGDSLLRIAESYHLMISDRLLTKDEQTIWKVLVHEAVHLGIPGHGEAFKKLVHEKGGAVSELALEGNTVKVQLKVGARYRTIKEFPTGEWNAAVAFAKAEHRLNPQSRYRVEA